MKPAGVMPLTPSPAGCAIQVTPEEEMKHFPEALILPDLEFYAIILATHNEISIFHWSKMF